MGAFSPPSFLLEDLLERFFVTVGLGEESVKDGIGLDMLMEVFDNNALIWFPVYICCMLLLCVVVLSFVLLCCYVMRTNKRCFLLVFWDDFFTFSALSRGLSLAGRPGAGIL
jgi:hypothetical protein